MDRNTALAAMPGCLEVALRKESVDRNVTIHRDNNPVRVALRKESVDRNSPATLGRAARQLSLSARRAWIEIVMLFFAILGAQSRSPQGERG